MTLIEQVAHYSKSHDLIRPKDIILIGVSGGADSVALLYILYALKYSLGLSLYIAHFNHALRKNSYQDALFVKKLAQKLHLPFYMKTWQRKKAIRGSIEDNARQQRQKFLMTIAKKVGAQKIALAHHKDDMAETVLMRILRGTGLQGLQGILPKKELYGFTFIRPLLNTSRQDIEHFLKNNNLIFAQDPTNKKTDFFRNKIRLKLLPLLKKTYSPNIKELLIGLAETASIDYDYLQSCAKTCFQKVAKISSSKKEIRLNLKKLQKMPDAILRMVIRESLSTLKKDGYSLDLKHLKEILDLYYHRPLNAIVHLPQGLKGYKKKTELIFSY